MGGLGFEREVGYVQRGGKLPVGLRQLLLMGETCTKSSYTDGNSKTFGVSMGDIAGNSSYDAARANWGGTGRLPTASEVDELVSKCRRERTTMDGHNGYKVTGPNGNSIFLPAAGWRYGTSLDLAGDDGEYWSSTPDGSDARLAYSLNFSSGNVGRYWSSRNYGYSVRPVSD